MSKPTPRQNPERKLPDSDSSAKVSTSPVENSQITVEKTTKIVEISEKIVENPVQNHQNPVENSTDDSVSSSLESAPASDSSSPMDAHEPHMRGDSSSPDSTTTPTEDTLLDDAENSSSTDAHSPDSTPPVENSKAGASPDREENNETAETDPEENVENSSETVENPAKNVEKSSENVENNVEKPVETSDSSSDNAADFSQRKTVIKVTNLHKGFRLPTEHANGLKQAIFNWLKGVKGYTEHQVLRGLDFEVKDGEFLGIVGRNGSGKSTLLKLLAQIYTPDQGSIEVDGTLVPFIELGVGFNPELTGRENVYLNGALLGFSNREMDAMYEEIVRFAELEQFMDAKLKNYSSGMQVRLAFSIAIRARGDILILDEVLAVGDAAFQAKCNDYFASLHGNQTVILVTHSMENVREYCDRAILIEDGKIAAEGLPDEVAKAYENLWK